MFVVLSGCLLYLFTDYAKNENAKLIYGNYLIYVIILFISLNMVIIFASVLNSLKLITMKTYNYLNRQ